MRRLALLVAHLHRFDAVANDTQGLKNFFEKRGIPTRIFAPSGDAGTQFYSIKSINKFINKNDDAVLLAYAGHWPLGEALFAKLPGSKILRYHNVTPPEFYAPYDPKSAHLCEAGRLGLLPLLAKTKIDLFLPDSQFNAEDLRLAGARKESLFVLPVFHQIDELLSALPSTKSPTLQDTNPTSGSFLNELGKKDLGLAITQELFPKDCRVFLMVGRIVPSKGWKNFLRTAHSYLNYFDRNAYFIMAGSLFSRLGKYYRELEALSYQLRLSKNLLHFSNLDAKKLSFLYRRAQALLLCSEHEGFCVPLVESMAFRLPIVGLKRGAVFETAKDAALLWQDFDSEQMAASLHRFSTDASARETLRTCGQKRYETLFSNLAVAQVLEGILRKIFPHSV